MKGNATVVDVPAAATTGATVVLDFGVLVVVVVVVVLVVVVGSDVVVLVVVVGSDEVVVVELELQWSIVSRRPSRYCHGGGPIDASAWSSPQKSGYAIDSVPALPTSDPTAGLPGTCGSFTHSLHWHCGLAEQSCGMMSCTCANASLMVSSAPPRCPVTPHAAPAEIMAVPTATMATAEAAISLYQPVILIVPRAALPSSPRNNVATHPDRYQFTGVDFKVHQF